LFAQFRDHLRAAIDPRPGHHRLSHPKAWAFPGPDAIAGKMPDWVAQEARRRAWLTSSTGFPNFASGVWKNAGYKKKKKRKKEKKKKKNTGDLPKRSVVRWWTMWS